MNTTTSTGAQCLLKRLEAEGIEYIFGIPGGVTLPMIDALVTSGTRLKFILVRHEQGATHMADGYARATGKPAAVMVTSGPGATNTITGIMTAHMDSIPMVVITGQQVTAMLGKDAFQEADIFGLTMPVVKHSYLVKDPYQVSRVVREACHITTTGRPGPVLIDMPKDVGAALCEVGRMPQEMDIPGYQAVTPPPNPASVQAIADALGRSRRPLLLVGHGAVISDAGAAVRQLAEKLQAPVVNTLLGKGGFPESHRLSLGMLGMHGTAYANKAVMECDLLLSIGARFDDRILGRPDRFCTGAVKIHIDIDPSEIGKMIRPDLFCVGDARAVVEALLPLVDRLDTAEWLTRVQWYKRRFPLHIGKHGGLKVQQIVREMYELTQGRAVVATDVGQHQMWTAQFYPVDHRRQWISSGGAGTMGFGLPAAIGAQFGRPRDTIVAFVGDGGFQMTSYELATACIHKLPIKVIVMNNHYLGMVRQWQELFYDDRQSGVDLEGNPDFAKLAEAYGARGFHLRRAADIRKVLTRALEYNDGPCVINAEVVKESNVFPMIPGGRPYEDMLIEPPRRKRRQSTKAAGGKK